MNTIGKLIFYVGVTISSFFGYKSEQSKPQTFGSFQPVQSSQTTLAGAGVTNSATTIQLTSFKLPDPNRTPISMSMFGGIGYAVLEPQTSKIENISFTGVTQNANGTALLTGVSRGLSFYSPYNASTTLALSHAGGAYLILTNSGAFYGKEFLFANNTGTSTAFVKLASTSPWRYDAEPIWANFPTTALASVAYVNSVVAAGCADASEVVNGCSQLATDVQLATGEEFGDTGARLVPPNSLFSSSFIASTIVPVTGVDGKLSQDFLDLTQVFAFSGNNTHSGQETFSNNNSFTGTNTFSLSTMATTTVADLRNSYGASYGGKIATLTTPVAFGSSDTATTTIISVNIPANFIATSSIIHGKLYFGDGASHNSTLNTGSFRMALNYGGKGNAYQTFATVTASSASGWIDFVLMGNGTTQSQYGIIAVVSNPSGGGQAITGGFNGEAVGTYSINSQTNQTLSVSGSFSNSDSSNQLNVTGGYIEIIN